MLQHSHAKQLMMEGKLPVTSANYVSRLSNYIHAKWLSASAFEVGCSGIERSIFFKKHI